MTKLIGRSITDRLRKSKGWQERLKFAHDWAETWREKHNHLLDGFQRAMMDDDFECMIDCVARTERLLDIKFRALHRMPT